MTPKARLFNRRFALLALLAAIGPAAAIAGSASAVPPPDLTARQIVDRALERNRANEEAKLESQFTFQIHTVSEKLDENGSVAETESRLYRSVPLPGGSFERLLEEDGNPIPVERAAEEDRRQREYLEKLRRGETAGKPARERVAFDENLTAKYDFSLLGVESFRGRSSYILGYKPKSGDLPVRNRMDRALNKAEGKIWFDAETFEVARVEFELKEKVRLWWGLIGSISALEGRVERSPLESGVWFPDSVTIYLDGRIFFSSLRRRETLRFSDFERIEPEKAAWLEASSTGTPR